LSEAELSAAFKPLAQIYPSDYQRRVTTPPDAESNGHLFLSALTRGRPQDTIFDRIHPALIPGGNPYLVENYASCETPNADRSTDRHSCVRLGLPDRPKTSFFASP
jgi:hypothetical protein